MKENPMLSFCIRWGFIIAGLNILLTLVLYAVNVAKLASISMGFLFFAINVGLLVYAGINYRKFKGGYADFKTMLIALFVVQIISGGIGVLFNTLLYHVIDPTIPEQLIEATLENTEDFMMRFDLPVDDIDETLENTEVELRKSLSVEGLLFSFFWPGLALSIAAALILAAILKKNKPIFEE